MIRIRTLGGLSASRDDRPPGGAATQPRRLALLALIARAGDRGITRERVLALLWPDADEEAGRRALSQALHALRTDLDEDLFLGVQELRLNLVATACDIIDFESALAAQDWERAAVAYAGPFLQGFRLAGAAEFDRWMEEERTHLSHRHAELMERLGRAASARGDAAAAVTWWRRRAAIDPLNARVTVELMRALAAAGERPAAVQQARIYEGLLAQELALEPDAEVLRFAEELRRAPAVSLVSSAAPVPASMPPASPGPARPTVPTDAVPPIPDSPARSRRRVFAVAILILAVAGTVVVQLGRRTPEQAPLLAVGAIADYRGSTESGPLTDMLATNLARIPGLQVVGTARLLELIARTGQEPGAASYAAAATNAGATDLMEGGLHTVEGGLLLELRRVNLATGKVRGAWRLEGKDLFGLVDSAIVSVAASLGRGATPIHDGVGTRSLVAWRFYEEGLRGFARGDYRGAIGLFEAALREDSTFAMAAYNQVRSRHALDFQPDSTERAWLERLAQGASDHERLQIRSWVAFAAQSPALDALADTLIVRYPADIEAQYLAAFARMARFDFAAALPWLHRVIAADSTALGAAGARCLACDALENLVRAYIGLDSIPLAERVAQSWTRSDPRSSRAWAALGSVLDIMGRPDEAIAARRRATPYDQFDNNFPALVWIRAGNFAAADQIARTVVTAGSDQESAWMGFWVLTISLRHQGRWHELARLAARRRGEVDTVESQRARRLRFIEAAALLELGQPRAAIPIFDSLIRHIGTQPPLGGPQLLTTYYAMLAEAALAAGDTGLVARAADSAQAWSRRIGKIREAGIASHAVALSQLAKGDTLGAMKTLAQAIYSPIIGFTRTSYHLARLRLARGEPRGAVDLLRPALQGDLTGGGHYVTLTDLHEVIAQAYDRLGMADSARIHWRWVAGALANADSAARPRYAAALARLGARAE